MSDTPLVKEAQADVRYHRERVALYRARSYAGRLTSSKRLRELELAFQAARERLRRALEGRGSSQ